MHELPCAWPERNRKQDAMYNRLKLFKVSASEIFYFVPYGIYLMVGILNTSFYGKYVEGAVYKLVAVAVIGVLAVREITFEKRTYTAKRVCFALVFCLLSFLIIIAGAGLSQKGLAFICVFVLTAKDIPFKKICRFTIWVSALTVAFVIISAYAGIIQNYTLEGGDRVRQFLGFKYALFPSAFAYNITALEVYQNREKPSVVGSIILIAINCWIYAKTDSRLSFGLAMVVVLLPLIIKLVPVIRWKLCGALASCSFIACCTVSFWLSVYYSPQKPWMSKLNSILGDRLRLGQASLAEFGVPFFGRRGIEWVGNGLDNSGQVIEGAYNYVDSLYIQAFQRYGVFVMVIILVLLSVAVYKFWKIGDYYMTLILVLFAFHGIIDDLLLYLFYNTFWFAMGILFVYRGQDFWTKRRSRMRSACMTLPTQVDITKTQKGSVPKA